MLRGKYKIKTATEERFWEKVDKKSVEECWEWLGSKFVKGYGCFYFDGKILRAHRYSWILHYGEIPDGFQVCHRCDNPSCVNPSHLFIGEQKDNTRDMIVKHRDAIIGERNNNAKLLEQDILEIRELRSKGLKYKELAEIFDVNLSTICMIVNKKIWSHIT